MPSPLVQFGKNAVNKIKPYVQDATNVVNKLKPYANLIASGITLAAGVTLAVEGVLNRTDLDNNDLKFPYDLPDYYMTLYFERYSRPSIFDSAFTIPAGGIHLPIPNNLVDSQTVTYNTASLGPGYGAAIAELDAKKNNAADYGNAIVGSAEGLAIGGAAGAAAGVTGSDLVSKVTTQTAGKALNPFLTVFFESPAFKEHTFTWKLTPRRIEESYAIKDIIKRFKTSMLPSLAGSSGGALFSYPDIVEIQLYPNDAYLYKFKKCVIKNMSVNYAPGNTPAFFKNSNAPTEVQITLNLQEIEMWTQKDFAG
jgi:hypothetical protein